MVPTIAATELETSTGITETTPPFSQNSALYVTPAVNQLQDGRSTIQNTKPNAHTFTINQQIIVADLKTFTARQASHVHPMSLEQLTLVSSYPDEATTVINQLFQLPEAPTRFKRWCEEAAHLNHIERLIYNEILKLRKLKKLDPTVDDDQRRHFWTSSVWKILN